MKYTWTKKNFGMDLEFVVETIAQNCLKKECAKKMRHVIAATLKNHPPSLLPRPLKAADLSLTAKKTPRFKATPPPQYGSPFPYPWTVPFPGGPAYSPSGIPFQLPLYTSMPGREQTMLDLSKGFTRGPTGNGGQYVMSKAMFGANKENEFADSNMPAMKFKRPTNVDDFKSLTECVKRKPSLYPKILSNKKTQFLSALGLAPKSICSSKTLKIFRRELKQKKLLTREDMIYQQRKVLRDRNKLRKNSYVRRSYLEVHRSENSVLARKKQANSSQGRSYLAPNAKRKLEHHPNGNRTKEDALLKKSPYQNVEVIDIASSDDETSKITIPPQESIISKKETEHMSDNEKKSTETAKFFTNITPPENNSVSQDVQQAGNSLNSVNSKHFSVPTMYYAFPPVQHYPLKPILTTNAGMQPLLLPKNIMKQNKAKKLHNYSSSLLHKKFKAPAIVRPFVLYENTQIKSNMISQKNMVSLEKMDSVVKNMLPYYAITRPNSIQRIIYPVPVLKTNPKEKVFFIGNAQKNSMQAVPTTFKSLSQQDPVAAGHSDATSNGCGKSWILTVDGLQEQNGKATARAIQTVGQDRRKGKKVKIDFSEEMKRISNSIHRMKAVLNPTMFHQDGVEKSVQRMINQLNLGIGLVRQARKSLLELERRVDNARTSNRP